MKKMICFDMDGTIADLYGVEGWLNHLQNENPWPYLTALPLCNMKSLRAVLLKLKKQGWEIRVISWLAKDSAPTYKDAVRMAKKAWLEHYNFPMDACHFIEYGATKADCIRRHHENGSNFILIDDNAKIRDGWHLGDTIDPTTTNIVDALWGLVE